MSAPEKESFYPENLQQWREWLQENHKKKASVWLIQYKKSVGFPTISWSEAVDQALCFGWIDSTKKKLDDDRTIQFFSPRKAKSTWSKINKDKVERLIADGSMTAAGLRCIEVAKENGSWTILDTVEALLVPEDLEKAFLDHNGSKAFFDGLSKSIRKQLLYWVISAKRPETRQKRIDEIAECAGRQQKPKQFG